MLRRYVVGCQFVALCCFAALPSAVAAECTVASEFRRASEVVPAGAAGAAGDAQREFFLTWADRLRGAMTDANCLQDQQVLRRLLLSCTNGLGLWLESQAVAGDGVAAAQSDAERALFAGDHAFATFQLRATVEHGRHRAIEALDAYIRLAPALETGNVDPSRSVSARPILSAYANRAMCLRELGDHLAAAAVEQQAAVVAAARLGPAQAADGGFLPEEALARAAGDFTAAGQLDAAAGTLVAVRSLASHVRPPSQHAWNLVTGLEDTDKAIRLCTMMRERLPMDEFLALACADVAYVAVASDVSAELAVAALQNTDAAITFMSANASRVDAALVAVNAPTRAPFYATRLADAKLALEKMIAQAAAAPR